ncbi:hypothetical protein NC653_026970 [Populus alba x Populus x berolinensis]|uniref:Uncharacterized protein n=1 Tax=Populus alba x Populus x berolinensis TaxID=444605 RepID=A0AAD6Q4I3_9ROSI|nr:hypothetical protein NC653_026970 [Populus alba x Populus x berolinensis]
MNYSLQDEEKRKSLRFCFCTGQYGKDMPVAYGESERLNLGF